MRHEELDVFFEEAFKKIEPQNEAHREKLARLQARFQQNREEANATIKKATEEAAEQRRAFEERKPEREAQQKTAREGWQGMLNGFDEQVVLLDRIVKAATKV